MNEENSWSTWSIPYKYLKRYFFLMIGILFILPILTGLRYTPVGFMVNYFFADALFYRWCIKKIEYKESNATKIKNEGE